MVLFDEDPVTLISETTNQFHIAPDRDSLLRISDSLASLSTARQARLDAHHANLQTLSRRLNGLQEGRRWEEDRRHDASVGHAARMLQMDTQKFRLAKGASDAEIERERLEGERAGLRTLLEGLEREGVEGGARRGGGGGGDDDEVVYVYGCAGDARFADVSRADSSSMRTSRWVFRRRRTRQRVSSHARWCASRRVQTDSSGGAVGRAEMSTSSMWMAK